MGRVCYLVMRFIIKKYIMGFLQTHFKLNFKLIMNFLKQLPSSGGYAIRR